MKVARHSLYLQQYPEEAPKEPQLFITPRRVSKSMAALIGAYATTEQTALLHIYCSVPLALVTTRPLVSVIAAYALSPGGLLAQLQLDSCWLVHAVSFLTHPPVSKYQIEADKFATDICEWSRGNVPIEASSANSLVALASRDRHNPDTKQLKSIEQLCREHVLSLPGPTEIAHQPRTDVNRLCRELALSTSVPAEEKRLVVCPPRTAVEADAPKGLVHWFQLPDFVVNKTARAHFWLEMQRWHDMASRRVLGGLVAAEAFQAGDAIDIWPDGTVRKAVVPPPPVVMDGESHSFRMGADTKEPLSISTHRDRSADMDLDLYSDSDDDNSPLDPDLEGIYD